MESSDNNARKAPRKPYVPPSLTEYGDIRDVAKGTLSYSLEEGIYAEFTPPS